MVAANEQNTFLAHLEQFIQANWEPVIEACEESVACGKMAVSRREAAPVQTLKKRSVTKPRKVVKDVCHKNSEKPAISEQKRQVKIQQIYDDLERLAARETMDERSGPLATYTQEELLALLNNYKQAGFIYIFNKFLREKHLEPVEVYKAVGMDRKLFSKIINHPQHKPSKKHVVMLCLGLKLNRDEALSLLKSAGYTFSHGLVEDLIIEFCLLNGQHDIYAVDELLHKYERPTLLQLD